MPGIHYCCLSFIIIALPSGSGGKNTLLTFFCFRMLVYASRLLFFLLANQRTYILLSVICILKCISHLFYLSTFLSFHPPPFPHYSGQILDNEVERKSTLLKNRVKNSTQIGSSNICNNYVCTSEKHTLV